MPARGAPPFPFPPYPPSLSPPVYIGPDSNGRPGSGRTPVSPFWRSVATTKWGAICGPQITPRARDRARAPQRRGRRCWRVGRRDARATPAPGAALRRWRSAGSARRGRYPRCSLRSHRGVSWKFPAFAVAAAGDRSPDGLYHLPSSHRRPGAGLTLVFRPRRRGMQNGQYDS